MKTKTKGGKQIKMNPDFAPPKEIGAALRGMFDYQDDKDFDGQTGLQRSYNGWQHLLVVLKAWTHADAKGFLEYIQKAEVDLNSLNDYQDPFKVTKP